VKIKLDENIPHTVARRLEGRPLDIDTVLDEGLRGHNDDEVWSAAQAEGRFLVTQDLDFSDRRKFAPGTHHGLLLVRLPESEQWRIGDYVTAWLSSPDLAT
jgi:predicted nuclease of predicted toxin-antitoxin system